MTILEKVKKKEGRKVSGGVKKENMKRRNNGQNVNGESALPPSSRLPNQNSSERVRPHARQSQTSGKGGERGSENRQNSNAHKKSILTKRNSLKNETIQRHEV